MSMIYITDENLEKLERFRFLLEDEDTSDTLDFILHAFNDDIEQFICEYLMRKESEEYENSEEYKAFQKKFDELADKQNA